MRFALLFMLGTTVAYGGDIRFTQQGRLNDSAGVPLDGTHNLVLSLYDSATGGSEVWRGRYDDTPFEQGYFLVTLTGTGEVGGDLDGALADGAPTWMAFSVDGGAELDPRQALAHVPSAARSARTGGVDIIDVDTGGFTCSMAGGLGFDTSRVTLYLCDGANWTEAAVGEIGIVTSGQTRTWANGSYAASCRDYFEPTAPRAYSGDTGDGIYRIDPAGTPVDVYCDMSSDGGGWTLVARMATDTNHIQTGTAGTFTSLNQLSGWKLADTTINDLATTHYRLTCDTLTRFFDPASGTFGAQNCGDASSINDYSNSYAESPSWTNGDGSGVPSSHCGVTGPGNNLTYAGQNSSSGCRHASDWSNTGHLYVK